MKEFDELINELRLKIQRVTALNLNKDEVLIVKVPKTGTQELVDSTSYVFQKLFPYNKILVDNIGCEYEIIKEKK